MATTDRKIFEYALKGLEAERDVILAEIAELRARLGGRLAAARRGRAARGIANEVAGTVSSLTKKAQRRKTAKKRRTLSAAQRKAISERMKKTWAARRRNKAVGKKPSAAKKRTRKKMTAA